MPRSSCDQLEKCDVQGGQFREGDSGALAKGVNEISRETIFEKAPNLQPLLVASPPMKTFVDKCPNQVERPCLNTCLLLFLTCM